MERLTITRYLSKFADLEIVSVCSNATDALFEIENNKVDILFLDIDMPDMSGLELRKKSKQVPVCIFATDHLEFALESFELETLDYLLKPYFFERFSQCVNRIREYMRIRTKALQYESEEEKNIFCIKEGHKKVKISLSDVLYLNAFQNYTMVVTLTEKHYVLLSLGSLLKEHNFQDFLRIHKSYARYEINHRNLSAFELSCRYEYLDTNFRTNSNPRQTITPIFGLEFLKNYGARIQLGVRSDRYKHSIANTTQYNNSLFIVQVQSRF